MRLGERNGEGIALATLLFLNTSSNALTDDNVRRIRIATLTKRDVRALELSHSPHFLSPLLGSARGSAERG